MEIITITISIISMVATVISMFIAINAKNKAQTILTEIKNSSISMNNRDESIKDTGSISVNNSGSNDGVMGGIVTGGIKKNDK